MEKKRDKVIFIYSPILYRLKYNLNICWAAFRNITRY